LADAGVPVGVMVAPIIPGLNDSEVPAILEAAAAAGAATAGSILLRLPLTVEPVFLEWLARARPEHQAKVEHRIRETRGGNMSSSQWGERMRGTGEIAEQIGSLFRVFAQKHGLNRKLPPLEFTHFRRPHDAGQLTLF
jgi:DNA repair photolyase